MLHPLSPTMHGAMDYATVAGTAIAPKMLGMKGNAATLAYAVAGSILAMAALTKRNRLSAMDAIPLKAHAASDSAMALALPAMPWALGFASNKRARNFFLGLTAVIAVSTLLTDWSEPKRRRSRTKR